MEPQEQPQRAFDRLDQFLSPEQLAERLNVTDRTIRKAVASGELPAFRVFNRTLIDPDAVEAWLQSKRVQPVKSAHSFRNPDFGRQA